MTSTLLQLQQQVQGCTYGGPESYPALQGLIRRIMLEIGQHYTAGDDTTAIYDIILRFQQAERHLITALKTSRGEQYEHAFSKAKGDTLYLFSLLQSAIHFGHLLPQTLEQEVSK